MALLATLSEFDLRAAAGALSDLERRTTRRSASRHAPQSAQPELSPASSDVPKSAPTPGMRLHAVLLGTTLSRKHAEYAIALLDNCTPEELKGLDEVEVYEAGETLEIGRYVGNWRFLLKRTQNKSAKPRRQRGTPPATLTTEPRIIRASERAAGTAPTHGATPSTNVGPNGAREGRGAGETSGTTAEHPSVSEVAGALAKSRPVPRGRFTSSGTLLGRDKLQALRRPMSPEAFAEQRALRPEGNSSSDEALERARAFLGLGAAANRAE